jgi:hypothetical protein
MNKIKVLSWNLCFGCMYSDPVKSSWNITSPVLVSYCVKQKLNTKVNQCAKNIAELVNKSSKTEKYDFIGFQEISNEENLHELISFSKPLQNMGVIHHKVSFGKGLSSQLATFYNHSKYKVLAVKIGNINKTSINKVADGRPYQIIFLESRIKRDKYIFINLHNDHNISQDMLERNLSKNIFDACRLDTYKDINFFNLDEIYETNISDIISYNKFNVISVGDYNDSGFGNYFLGLHPFKYSKSIYLKDIKIQSNKQPVHTCCMGNKLRKSKSNDKNYGDYILINDNLKYIVENIVPVSFVYNAKKTPTSDHLPVMSILRLKKSIKNKSLK